MDALEEVVGPPGPVLEVQGVSKTFAGIMALDDVSLSFGAGRIYGIAGPNGAGKSTLFNVMTKVPFGPDRGEVLLGGRPLTRMSPRRIAHAGLVRTWQTEAVFGSLTVYQNVQAISGLGARGVHENSQARTADALERVNLAAVANRRAAELSLLEKKRLMVATALVLRPKVLMLDEPASGLNAAEQDAMGRLIREINRAGVTIIIIEHILPLLVSLCERLTILNFGKILVSGAPRRVLESQAVIDAYVG